MSAAPSFVAKVDWRLEGDFLARRYSRAHRITFEGGLEVPGSPSTHFVPAAYGQAGAVDPEAAFVAALAACHMLWFLDFAAQAGFVVASYSDEAVGTLGRDDQRRLMMTRVVLSPRTEFSGERQPTPAELEALHHRAHETCLIANSVRTEVVVSLRPD